MKIRDILESATAGATSTGNIATVSNPNVAYSKKTKQPKKKDGTAVNALDMKGTSIFGGAGIKRESAEKNKKSVSEGWGSDDVTSYRSGYTLWTRTQSGSAGEPRYWLYRTPNHMVGQDDRDIARAIRSQKPVGKYGSAEEAFLAMKSGVSEGSLDDINFSNELGKLAISDNEIISQSAKSGTIGSREVYLFKRGSDRIYFFARDNKIDALLYLHQDRLMAMKNFSANKGLIYNLFQYVVGMLQQKIKLSAVDKLTPDGIKWIVNQSTQANGFTITDGNGQPIDPKKLYAEWNRARITGQPGPTEIVIKESKIGVKLRENENRLMPMDIFGATLLANSTEYMGNLYEGVAEGSVEENKKGVRAVKSHIKPRNFVAKNAVQSGAGEHKDRKKAAKQGDVKHKKPAYEEALDLALRQALDVMEGYGRYWCSTDKKWKERKGPKQSRK